MKAMIYGAVAAFSVAAAGYANAADLETYEPPMEAPITEVGGLYDWNGVYVGATVGYSWTGIDYSGGGAPAIDRTLEGALLGAHIGYNYQNGNWVFGVEGDVRHDFNESRFAVGGTTYEAETEWGGSVRARIGYAIDRTLIYGTGGYAFTRASLEDVGAGLSDKETFHGWTIGAGVEQAFTDNVIGRIEYRYADYDKSNIFGVPGSDGDIDSHSVMVGVSWKF